MLIRNKKILLFIISVLLSNFLYGDSEKTIFDYIKENELKEVNEIAPSVEYIYKEWGKDRFYIPFTYDVEGTINGQEVILSYIFTEIGDEMVNRFFSISFFDEDGNRFVYEKENKNMDLGNKTIVWQGKIGHKARKQYENPILHLWE